LSRSSLELRVHNYSCRFNRLKSLETQDFAKLWRELPQRLRKKIWLHCRLYCKAFTTWIKLWEQNTLQLLAIPVRV
jgi:hypothetical protein